VCWKYNKTPRHLKTRARELVNNYCNTFIEDPESEYLTFENTELEIAFYRWLYDEFN
jgi:hypothetical protein